MKRIITTFFVAGILISCNSKEASKTEAAEAATTENLTESAAAETNTKLVAIDSDEALVATALMAAPAESREGAKVIGYNLAGEFVTLKEGDNEFIVLADDLNKPGFSAACYHKSLEPFMARGRELKAQGKTGGEIFDIREEEAKAGTLDMGQPGATLHIYFGAGELYDPETNIVAGAQYRYVVYMPFATSESTGLPEEPIGRNHPWIMNPGTHRAHIMISPKADEKE
ncbi:MAG: hypothetical protein ABJM06_09440 [Gilvibacter sp.]